MGKVSKIEYVDSSWSPWYGCTKASDACTNCYAEAQMKRFGKDFSTVTRAADPTFYAPDRWKEPRRIFVCELSDFFHPDAAGWRIDAYNVMWFTPWHTYLLLTKRHQSMHVHWCAQEQIPDHRPRNIWLGVTAENQEWANRRIPTLLKVQTPIRFVSIEPMLGPVDLSGLWACRDGCGHRLSWVIVGGESGPNRREMKIEWLEDIVAQCRAANVPVFVKQDAALHPGRQGRIPDELWVKEFPA